MNIKDLAISVERNVAVGEVESPPISFIVLRPSLPTFAECAMSESVPRLSARKLFSRTHKRAASEVKSEHDTARPRDALEPINSHKPAKSVGSINPQDMWPVQGMMCGLPSVPRPRPKSSRAGYPPALEAFFPARPPSRQPPPTSRTPHIPRGKYIHRQPNAAELDASESPFAKLPNEHRADSFQDAVIELPTPSNDDCLGPAELEAAESPSTSKPDVQSFGTSPKERRDIPELSSDPPPSASSNPVELCSCQGVAEQPSNNVYNILKEMKTPIHSNKGGYVYFSEDVNARGLLKIGYAETWDEPWVLDIPDNVVYRPDFRQSNTLGKRIRQRKSTCGLWPVMKLVAPMRHAARKMELLARLTLVDDRRQSADSSETERFTCSLERAERVLRMWQRFSNLKPFMPSGYLEPVWGKYVKNGLRGRWGIASVEKWISASLEPMLWKMESVCDRIGVREGFEADQRVALQLILRSLEEQGRTEKIS